MDEKIKGAIKAIVGKENFTDSLIDRIAYAKDASEFKHRPDAAVWPLTREHVAAILRWGSLPRSSSRSIPNRP
jgi:FAD/FMN-containing dehydrogenase